MFPEASAAPGSENQDVPGWAGRTAARVLPYALPYAWTWIQNTRLPRGLTTVEKWWSFLKELRLKAAGCWCRLECSNICNDASSPSFQCARHMATSQTYQTYQPLLKNYLAEGLESCSLNQVASNRMGYATSGQHRLCQWICRPSKPGGLMRLSWLLPVFPHASAQKNPWLGRSLRHFTCLSSSKGMRSAVPCFPSCSKLSAWSKLCPLSTNSKKNPVLPVTCAKGSHQTAVFFHLPEAAFKQFLGASMADSWRNMMWWLLQERFELVRLRLGHRLPQSGLKTRENFCSLDLFLASPSWP